MCDLDWLVLTDAENTDTYFVKAMAHYKDKEMLVAPFNMGNHSVTLSISTMYDQVWYCDSSRPSDPRTGDRLTCDWNDVIFVLDKFLLHFGFSLFPHCTIIFH
jgi:hypothetical protein